MFLVACPLVRSDIEALVAIEAVSHRTPWSATMFAGELDNGIARFWVYRFSPDASCGRLLDEYAASSPAGRVSAGRCPEPSGTVLAGYGGFWNMVGDGNITNVTVAPEFRRCGLGRRIVAHLLAEMNDLKMEYASLEVRESNLPAIALYEQAGFIRLGARKGYYGDGETALIYGLGLDASRAAHPGTDCP